MSQGETLKELKSVLRSLVVSSPTQVDVRSLLRDYRNMMGAPVPLSKFGYRDPMLFLKENCSDCFVFQGPPSNPVLTLIVPDALKHIDKFVQKQKVSSTIKHKGKRRSIPEQVLKDPDLIANTFIPKQVELNNRSIKRPEEMHRITDQRPSEINKITKQKPTEIINYKESDITNKSLVTNNKTCSNLNNNSTEKTNKDSIVQDKENHQGQTKDQVDGEESNSQNAVLNFLKKRMPLYSSTNQLDTDLSYPYNSKTSSKEDKDSGRQTISSSGSSKAALLEELKMEIRDLIADYPDGIWCTDLIRLYRERYDRELNFTRLGFTSIVSLVCMAEDVVRISRPQDTGDWRLADARRAPAPAPRRALPLPLLAARAALRPLDRVDADDALPGIDFDPDVFPPDCLHFMETIPPPPLGGLETGAMLEVVVGEVYSPSHFWLLRLGETYNIAMEDMMDEMTKYYTFGEGKDRWLALGAVRVGHYCSSVYERDWHRSLIVRIVDSDTVKVRHVDYGTVESVRVSSLKPLKRCWGALPAQALRARLAAVRPPAAGRRWPHAASTHFLRRVRDARLVANVVAVDREEDILEVFLIDTSTEEDVCVSTELVRAGYADARADSALRTPECYLFPRFEALEAGDTPNFGEIHAYLRDGISLDYVEEFRRHVPACLPPAPPTPPSPAHSHCAAYRPDDTLDDTPNDGSKASDDPTNPEDHPSRTPSPVSRHTPGSLTRAASSPGEASSPRAEAPPARSKSENPDGAAPDAILEVINRVPLRPRPPPPRPRAPLPPPQRYLPPARQPLPHAYSQMLPLPGYAGYPPFPGAVPLFPPMYPPPPPLLPLPPPCPYAPASYGPPLSPYPMPPTSISAHPSPAGPEVPATPVDARRTPAPLPPRCTSPPPPYNGIATSEASEARGTASAPTGAVTLTVSECEIFKLLSSVDANAAHWYMVDAISRAMRTSTTSARAAPVSTLDPTAPEFRQVTAAGTQTDAPPAFALPPGMRPPPGFGPRG